MCFLTKRPASAGDAVQFQTQWWLEQQGFYLPAVITVPGSRGDLANALRLDLAIDDQFVNCAEIIGAGPTKALLMLRDPTIRRCGSTRSIAASASSRPLPKRLPILQQLDRADSKPARPMIRLSEWFRPKTARRCRTARGLRERCRILQPCRTPHHRRCGITPTKAQPRLLLVERGREIARAARAAGTSDALSAATANTTAAVTSDTGSAAVTPNK